MSRPVIGIIGNSHIFENRFPVQLVGNRNMAAVRDVAGGLPLMFAADPAITDIEALLEVVDGVLLTGARANVHPRHFGMEANPKHEPYDEERDSIALPLIDACVARGVPVFGICRGFQEMAVAGGATLHPEIRELPGRINHRMPRLETGEIHPDPTVVFADRHGVDLTPGGVFSGLFGAEKIRVNSLHGQGILELGDRIVVEGVADDGTVEAIRMREARDFALGVQWHAEYDRRPTRSTAPSSRPSARPRVPIAPRVSAAACRSGSGVRLRADAPSLPKGRRGLRPGSYRTLPVCPRSRRK